jgi:hypothetical protein
MLRVVLKKFLIHNEINMRKKKPTDDRMQFLMRYRIDHKGGVSFFDPCCDEIPTELFGEIMKAFSHIQKKWNSAIAGDELSVFFETMNRIIISGEVAIEKYYSVELKSSIKTLLRDSHDIKPIFFTPAKNVLFLRLCPLYYRLFKIGCVQNISISKIEFLLRKHPSFIGYVVAKRFMYNESQGDKTVCSSCMALDYDLFSAAFNVK